MGHIELKSVLTGLLASWVLQGESVLLPMVLLGRMCPSHFQLPEPPRLMTPFFGLQSQQCNAFESTPLSDVFSAITSPSLTLTFLLP